MARHRSSPSRGRASAVGRRAATLDAAGKTRLAARRYACIPPDFAARVCGAEKASAAARSMEWIALSSSYKALRSAAASLSGAETTMRLFNSLARA